MSFNVKLVPGNKEFLSARNESLLEAALRAGVALKYSCNSGACGECSARLVSGQTSEIQMHDFRLSDAQRDAGHMLMCCVAADSDVVVEVHEIGVVEEIPVQRIATRVEKLEHLQDDLLILYLRTPRSQTLRFLAGQHVSLAIDGVGVRNKSLASCPCNAMNLQFHIHRVPGDAFSEYVFDQLKTGQTVSVEGPWGDFSLDESSPRPIIFVAYETGFAPIKSIIEHTFALEVERPVHLYWMVRHEGLHYLQNLCRSWVDAMDNFSYTPLHGDAPLQGCAKAENAEERDMAVLSAAIASDHPELSGFDVYLTAPDRSVQRVTERLMQLGLPATQLHLDVMQRN